MNRIAWFYLLLAILMEVFATVAMKLAAGFTFFLPSLLIFICYSISLSSLTLSLKYFDISIAYAIWSALGTLLICIIGIYFFHETLTSTKIISLLLIIIGVVGLKQE